MSKSFIFSSLKPLLAVAVIATGAVVGLSEVAPANALVLGSANGNGVTGFAANDWVHLIYPTNAGAKDRIAGVIILQSLKADAAEFRIRIDNKLSAAIDQIRFTLSNVGGFSGKISQNPLGVTFPVGDVDVFNEVSVGGGDGSRTITLLTNGGNLNSGAFDEFILTLNGKKGETTFSTNGLSLNSFAYRLSGENENFFSGQISTVPTPALLPGLIGLGVGALRKKRKQEEAVEVEADA